MDKYGELVELISKMAKDAGGISEGAYRLANDISYFEKADLGDPAVAADIEAMSAAIESLVGQIAVLDVAARFVIQLRRYYIDASSKELDVAVERAIEGESVFLYADGTLPQVARFAASVHGLVGDRPPYSSLAESTYFRGSLIGFLFRGNREATARVGGRAKDALVGKTSAEMTHEEVRSYREFVEATLAIPSAILITERYAFAKVAAGVFAFHLDTTRKAALRQEPVLAVDPESFVKRMLDLPQPEDVELAPPGNSEST